jgi:hypothetical protein
MAKARVCVQSAEGDAGGAAMVAWHAGNRKAGREAGALANWQLN